MRRFAALLLAASLIAPPGAGAAACPNATTSGRWTVIAMPPETVGWPAIVVPPARSGRDVLVAASQRKMFRSADGGCTWQQAYDLDADPPMTAEVRRNALLRFSDLSVSGVRNGVRTTYALLTDEEGALATSLPIATLVSTDGGVHWRLNEVPTGAAATAYPRCSTPSAIAAGPDPSIAHLSCDAGSPGEFVTSAFGPHCPSIVYVTTDAGRTWQPGSGTLVDPAKIDPDEVNGACGPMAKHRGRPVVADPLATRTIWRMSLCGDAVVRSTRSGADATTFAATEARPTYCGGQLVVGALPRGGVVAVVCDGPGPWVFTATKPGSLTKTMPGLRADEQGTVHGCTWDSRTGRVMVFYVDGHHRARVFTYDVARRAWGSLAYLPAPRSGQVWLDGDVVEGGVSDVSRMLYVRAGSSRPVLYRTAL